MGLLLSRANGESTRTKRDRSTVGGCAGADGRIAVDHLCRPNAEPIGVRRCTERLSRATMAMWCSPGRELCVRNSMDVASASIGRS